MNHLYSWIYVDYENNIWMFSKNNNSELCYKIMYGERKWTKESLIDKDIVGFAINAEKDGKIHIVYSCLNGQIKYCTLKDRQWIGRILYLMDCDKFEIQNLKVEIIGDEMHIFYLLIETDNSDHGVLVHSIWNGKETKTSKLLDITLIPDVKENYTVKVDNESTIDVLFISDEEKEITLNYCCYKNHRWSLVKRLYSIEGHDIGFEMLSDQQYIHILNKHRDGSGYFLDHVRVELKKDIEKFRIHESRFELSAPLLSMQGNKLCACWLEENKIFYSFFDGVNWSGPTYFNRDNEYRVRRYHFYIVCDKDYPALEREIYGTGDADLELYFPSEFALEGKELLNHEASHSDEVRHYANQIDVPQKVEALQSIKLRLYREKAENKRLNNAIASLTAQLQKKQGQIDTQKEKIAKILEQKQNTDENCDMFIELQQKMQKKLEYLNRRLLEEKNYKTSLENKLKELEEKLASEKNKSFVERLLKG